MCNARHSLFFFFNDTATTEIYTLSLHDALPILTEQLVHHASDGKDVGGGRDRAVGNLLGRHVRRRAHDRSEEHTSELQSRLHLVCRLLLEKKKTSIHNEDDATHILQASKSPATT